MSFDCAQDDKTKKSSNKRSIPNAVSASIKISVTFIFQFPRMQCIKGIIFLLIFILTSCKTNQTCHKLKCGKWVYQDTVNGVPLKSFGKYRKGVEKKTWLYYENNQLVKKEKYKHNICYVTKYFENGVVASTGKTKLVTSTDDTHWYYFGDWNFYNQSGVLTEQKIYENGALLSETKIE